MSQPLRLLADGFRLNDQVMEMVTKDFDAADWFRRPEAGGNHAVWLLGHLAGKLADRLGDAIVPLDDLVRDLGVPVPDLLAALGRLELEGAVTALPGQRFRIRGLP